MVGDWTSLHDEGPAKFVPITATAANKVEAFKKTEAIVASVREISSL